MLQFLAKENKRQISRLFSIIIIIILLYTIKSIQNNLIFGSFQKNLLIKISSESDFLTHDDLINGFSIKYPHDWQVSQRIDKSVIFIAPKDSNSETYPAGIMLKAIPSNLSLSSITKSQLNILKNLYPDINILESIETTSAGHPAHKLIFTAIDNTQTMRKAMQIWFKEDEKAFLITYKAEDEKFSQYLSTIEKMLNSLYVYK